MSFCRNAGENALCDLISGYGDPATEIKTEFIPERVTRRGLRLAVFSFLLYLHGNVYEKAGFEKLRNLISDIEKLEPDAQDRFILQLDKYIRKLWPGTWSAFRIKRKWNHLTGNRDFS